MTVTQKTALVSLVLVIGLGLIWFLKGPQAGLPAKSSNYQPGNRGVVLAPARKSLGVVVYGDVAKTTFTLTNDTSVPLKITRVSTSCGCTRASVDKQELRAYEATIVRVAFDPAVHQDDTDLGDLTRTIYIETNNTQFPQLEGTITATVVKK